MKKRQKEYEICYFFDIETSRIKPDNGDYIQCMYLANIVKMNMLNGEVVESVFFRVWNDIFDYLIKESKKKDIIVYCHNLDYENSFMARELKANGISTQDVNIYGLPVEMSVFRDTHSPLSLFYEELPYVNFRCSYALLNKSVNKLGSDLICKGENLPKLEYNYEKVRTYFDELEQIDYDYNERDNIIVARSIYNYLKDNDITLKELTLTFTGMTKYRRRKFINDNYGKNILASLHLDKINRCVDYDLFSIALKCYQGGLTTSNQHLFNIPLKNVYSIDIKSSYPYQMCSKKYPVFSEEYTYFISGDDCDVWSREFIKNNYLDIKKDGVKGFVALISFYDLKVKDERYLLPLSYNHLVECEEENTRIINGKVSHCSYGRMYINDIDLKWLNLVYDFEIEFEYIYYTTKRKYLRECETSFLLDCFNIKENIDKEKYPLEYALSKIDINAMYGVKVQKPMKDFYKMVEGEVYKEEYSKIEFSKNISFSQEDIYYNLIKEEEENNKGFRGKMSSSFDIYTNGIYITSFARLQLVEQMVNICKLEFIPIYCDTDSLKITHISNLSKEKRDIFQQQKISHKKRFSNYSNVNNIITNYLTKVNEKTIENNKENIRFNSYKDKFNVSENSFNKICKLGIWECENEVKVNGENTIIPYKFFKTLGAKKYVQIEYYQDKERKDMREKIKTTIAGCSKKVSEDITLFCDKNNIEYDVGLNMIFTPSTKFDESCTRKLMSIREKRSREECLELTYKGKLLNSCGGIMFEPTTYLLNLSIEDGKTLGLERLDKEKQVLNNKGILIEL